MTSKEIWEWLKNNPDSNVYVNVRLFLGYSGIVQITRKELECVISFYKGSDFLTQIDDDGDLIVGA